MYQHLNTVLPAGVGKTCQACWQRQPAMSAHSLRLPCPIHGTWTRKDTSFMQSGQEWTIFVSFVHGLFRIIKKVYTNFNRVSAFSHLGKGLRWHANHIAPVLAVLEAKALLLSSWGMHLAFWNSISAAATRICLSEKSEFKVVADRVNLSLFSALKPSLRDLNPHN